MTGTAKSQTGGERARRLLGKLVLVLAGVLVPLLLVEVALRMAGPILPGTYQTEAFTVRSNVYGWTNNPNRDGWIKTSAYTSRVRTNSKGLRGGEIEYAKPPGTFRILVLGDSFTFAEQVAEEQTLTALLPALLREQRSITQIETINAGVDGWGTLAEYAWLQTEGYKYEPDLVLLMFFVGNDPANNLAQLDELKEDEHQQLGVALTGQLRSLRETLARHSRLYSMVEYGVIAKLGGPPPETTRPQDLTGMDLTKLSPEWQAWGWSVSEAVLARLRDYASTSGMRVAVVAIPTAAQVETSAELPTPLADITGRVGLPFIDLLDPFRSQPDSRRQHLYLPKDLHWTADGQALGAEVVASQLMAQGLVPAANGAAPVAAPSPDRPHRAPEQVTAPLLTLRGHQAAVHAVSFAPSGGLLASASADGTVRIWNAADATPVQTLTGPGGGFTSVAFSPDGAYCAAGAADSTIWIWRVDDWASVRVLKGHASAVTALAFTPNGEFLISGSDDERARIWRMADGSHRRMFAKHDGPLTGLAASSDGETIASSSLDGTVRLWQPNDVAQLYSIDWEPKGVTGVAITPDSRTVAAGSTEGAIQVWRVASGQPLYDVPGTDGAVRGLAFSPDDQTLAWGTEAGTIHQARTADGVVTRQLLGSGQPIRSIAYAPDGERLASGTADGAVHIWAAR